MSPENNSLTVEPAVPEVKPWYKQKKTWAIVIAAVQTVALPILLPMISADLSAKHGLAISGVIDALAVAFVGAEAYKDSKVIVANIEAAAMKFVESVKNQPK